MKGSDAIHPNIMAVEEGIAHFYIGKVTNISTDSAKITVHCADTQVLLHFVHESLFRVKLNTQGPVNEKTTDAIYRKEWPVIDIEVEEQESYYRIVTNSLEVRIAKNPMRISVYNREGMLVHQDDPARGIGWNEKKEVMTFKTMAPSEKIYGLGEKAGFLNKRGTKQSMWNSDIYAPHNEETNELYESIPFFASLSDTGVYGIYLDNPARTIFDFTQADTYSFKAEAGELDYYFFYAANLKKLVQQYTELTGRMSLPPKWALGFHQSRYSYQSEDEVREVADTMRSKNIPCDVIHLDIHYMDEYRVFTWHPSKFANGHALIQELREKGFHVVPIVDPGIKKDPQYRVYQEGVQNDYFCRYLEGEIYTGNVWPGESAWPDFTEENVRNWWGSLHKHYTDAGIKGIWNDMNEPAVFNETKTMDVNVMHGNDGDPKTHKELHNIYGYQMSRATYEGLQTLLQGERPFVVTRAGFAGTQRYAAVWTGDNRSFWEHLAMSIPMFLSMGVSGLPFVGADIGGFAHPTNGPLLARWTQFGAFSPFCRNHSALDVPRQEPWVFGNEIEAICRKYIELRYRLMPHLYQLFYEASQTGLPVLRPLVMEYPQDERTFNLSDQALVGDSILLAPVYRPDTEYRVVYLPAGTWVDYWTGAVHNGEQHIMVHTPLDVMPIFIKAGSFIAQGPVEQYAGEKQGSDLQLHVYPGTLRQFQQYELYEDDGLTYEYQQGQYNLLNAEGALEANQLKLSFKYTHKGYNSGREALQFVVHGVQEPRNVQCTDGAKVEWFYDQDTRLLTLRTKDDTDQRQISVQF